MVVGGVCFGNQIGGVAFLSSIGTSIVELCFEDNEQKKADRETLFITINQYQDFEEISVAESSVFSYYVNSDIEFDQAMVSKITFENYGDEFDENYHEDIKADISKSVFAKEIALARYALDLFKQEEYGKLGELYGTEADDFNAPDVSYDHSNEY